MKAKYAAIVMSIPKNTQSNTIKQANDWNKVDSNHGERDTHNYAYYHDFLSQ